LQKPVTLLPPARSKPIASPALRLAAGRTGNEPAAERKAELVERLPKASQEGITNAIAGAIFDAIDASMRERNRPGRRDRLPADAEDRHGLRR
jgi:hypothetical protein